MPPTLSEFKRHLATAPVREKPINTALLEVAAVKASDLTGHPGWDRFLEQVQALLNTAEAELKTWTDRCCDAYKEEDLRFAQRNVTAYKTQVETLTRVMQMPNEILKEYHDAAQSR